MSAWASAWAKAWEQRHRQPFSWRSLLLFAGLLSVGGIIIGLFLPPILADPGSQEPKEVVMAEGEHCYNVRSDKDSLEVINLDLDPGTLLKAGQIVQVTAEIRYRLDSHDSARISLYHTLEDGTTGSFTGVQVSKGIGTAFLDGEFEALNLDTMQISMHLEPLHSTVQAAGFDCWSSMVRDPVGTYPTQVAIARARPEPIPTAVSFPAVPVRPTPTSTPVIGTVGPQYGGTLRLALPQDPFTTNRPDDGFSLVGLLFNRLVRYQDKEGADPSYLALEPDLAKDWEEFDGGRTFVFHLRQGVRFHDGSFLTADDVAATLESMRDWGAPTPRPFGTTWRVWRWWTNIRYWCVSTSPTSPSWSSWPTPMPPSSPNPYWPKR